MSSPPLPHLLPTGATLQSFPVGPTNHNIVLAFPTPAAYAAHNAPYFGETIGRYANRIAHATFRANGRTYTLAANNSPNSLHGGATGWGKKLWRVRRETRADGTGAAREATLYEYLSAHGEEGYPGEVTARVWAWAARKGPTTTLELELEAAMTGDVAAEAGVAETVVSLTNHAYFNLTAGPSVAGTRVTLPSTLHLPVDDTAIPTGAVEAFPGIPEGEAFELGEEAPRIDHCMVLREADGRACDPAAVGVDTRAAEMRELVRMSAADTGITLVVESTERAFQCYTGDGNAVPAGDGWRAYGKRSGVAIEPSRWVNAVNVPEWEKQVRVKRGEVWGSRIRYTAWTEV